MPGVGSFAEKRISPIRRVTAAVADEIADVLRQTATTYVNAQTRIDDAIAQLEPIAIFIRLQAAARHANMG